MQRIFITLALALSTFCSYAADPLPAPKVDPDVKTPVAKLTGPQKAHVGEQLRYTTEGSSGADLLFSISPPTTSFEPVKLMDGKDTPGVIYTPSRPGTYYIYLMLNSNGKTGYALLILTVEGSIPPTPDNPDKTFFNLKDAIKADKAADAQAGQTIAQLEALFGQWGTMAEASTTWPQFLKTFKDAATASLEDKLPASRKAIAEYIATRLPKDGATPYDKNLIKVVAGEVLQTVKLSK